MFDSYPNRRKLIRKIIFWTILTSALLAFFMPNLVRSFAAINDKTGNVCENFGTCLTGLDKPPAGDTGEFASDLILQLAGILAYICGSLAILFIMKGAWDMMNSEGDAAKFQKARTSMGYAIAGLFVVAASWGIVASVLSFLYRVQIGG